MADSVENSNDAIVDIDVPVKRTVRKSGGTFASMGLSRPVLNAVERKGYKLATPIQRKCIPPIMLGKDLVAMARTGSGKSAAFLLPIIDKLKIRQPKSTTRAIILSPTRELATQTFKFVKEFSRYTNLVSKLIIGGESIGKDFETITSSPDILVATPGRLAHVLVEMKSKLEGAEIVVFDEADRLFEPGFKELEQVNEICNRLPDSRQTLLFSATMPQKLADFAKLDLKDPLFVRLDVESNLSESLKSIFLHCNQQDKFAILLSLLKNFVKDDQMTLVFMPTRHHVEYAKMLLDNSKIDSCNVYSSMDPEARKININKFAKKVCNVMLVTDIAARGIDIPLLDIVINYNFPFKPKLYIHRAGRVARAGRFGCAISLVSHDEMPYYHALNVFLGNPINIASELPVATSNSKDLAFLPNMVIGSVPQHVLDNENDILKRWHEHDEDLMAMVKVCDNAMKPYLKTREAPAAFSVKASKDIHRKSIGVHPIFKCISKDSDRVNEEEDAREIGLLKRIKAFKPTSTIFEVGHIKGNRKTEAFGVMQKQRSLHVKIANKKNRNPELDEHMQSIESGSAKLEQDSGCVIKKDFEDSRFYLKYQPDNYAKEKGLEIDKTTFNNQLKQATLNLVADDEDQIKRQKHQLVWDRKKKKYISSSQLLDQDKRSKKIKTESGAYISASYQSGLYEKWKSQSKVEQRLEDDENDSESERKSTQVKRKRNGQFSRNAKAQNNRISLDVLKAKLKPMKRRGKELKNPDEMLKERNIKEKREAILRIKTMRKAQRKNQKKTGNSGKGGAGGKARAGKGAKPGAKTRVARGRVGKK